ncbi:acyclic terpene utilization AtuA family protein [Chondromyces crocatus]|uniref:Exopolyphosphatase n=1 Tax=Chondromyces crocatus TaxID=52 RepID=A0A0K1E9M2_CHOCO|nr:acyclic terpene utilization AtuA family protein [Chondromyces crocatus]AKT37555.1 exopolyphosphatase [Chondromyces crocatus]
MSAREPLIIANASGFYGDRFSALEEALRGGPVHVITGDYLAELTMALLLRARMKDPRLGYAATFVSQLERILGECLDRGVKVVTNAGGLNPRGLATAIEALASRLGRSPRVAVVEGDDLAGRLDDLRREGQTFSHLDRGIPLAEAGGMPVTANAYLGGWGIRDALLAGADIVVTGRVADAALVLGPAAAHFGWARDDWDKLAGAIAAGHILECGAQATGGNYAFFEDVPGLEHVGFPLAEIREDGTAIITKHPGTGGLVSTGTVTAQLLYEIDAPRYLTPDVTAHFDALELLQDAPDRVLVRGARGEPPPPTLKVGALVARGYRHTVGFYLAGLDLDAKAALLERALLAATGGREAFTRFEARIVRRPPPEPQSGEEALAELRVTVASPDPERVGRRFAARAVELALSTVPGLTLTAPPGDAIPDVAFWPCLVDREHIQERVVFGNEILTVPPPPTLLVPSAPTAAEPPSTAPPHDGPTERIALGRLFGARSGDKAGNANLGVWARSPAAHEFLRTFLTVERLEALLPETESYAVERYELPNLLALNFVIRGILGDGVGASSRLDPQAKTLSEVLRACLIDVPASLVKH